jgi:hypothetical protein
MIEKKNDLAIEFDFDYWMALAKSDPEAFEKQKREEIGAVINRAPEELQHRLNGLQWSIDAKVKTAKNPMDACLKVYQMMMDSVYEKDGLLDALKMTSSTPPVKENKSNVIRMGSGKK